MNINTKIKIHQYMQTPVTVCVKGMKPVSRRSPLLLNRPPGFT